MPASKRILDFTNVQEGGEFNPRRKTAGDYRAKIKKVEDHTSKQGNDGWVFTIVPTGDQRATYPYYVGEDAKQAWKARNLFIAGGIPVPKKRVNADPNKLVGREIGITLDDDEYEGKPKSVITAVFPTDDLAEDEPEQEEEEAPRRSTKKTATKKKRRPVEDDDDDDEDVDELDLEEL